MAETSWSGLVNLHTLVSVLWCILCFQRITCLRTYFEPQSLNYDPEFIYYPKHLLTHLHLF